MINETAQTIIESTKAEIYNTSIIIIWASVLLIFGLVTYLNSLGYKTKWDNFWRIYVWTAVISGALVMIFVMSPNTISGIINWTGEFLGLL